MVYHREEVIEKEKPLAVEPAVEPPRVIPAGFEYDTPPPQWVAGTVVPADTAPEDLTDAEYVQWCFDNKMPYWAIKKEILLRNPPVLSALTPSTAAIGDPSFTLFISGENFVEPYSVIVFAGHDEPTSFNEDGTVSTGVNMDYWRGPDVIQVQVRNGTQVSEPLEFTFTAAPEADDQSGDDDDCEPDDGKPAKKSKKKK